MIKFVSSLQKGVYLYKYRDDWEKFHETLPKKEDFYSSLNMEDITEYEIRV